jgi:putative endopeptidase
MKKNYKLFTFMLSGAAALATLTVACSNLKKEATVPTAAANTLPGIPAGLVPSSEIPARREFPVNPKISACVDFYEYACSEVNASFKLRPDRSFHDFAFSDSAERLLEAKKTFFKNIEKDHHLGSRGRQLQDNYMACMDEADSKQEELSWNQKTIGELAKIKSNQEMQAFLGSKILTGEPAFIEFGIDSNLDNPNKNDAYILTSLQNLPERSYYDNAELMKDYTALIAQTLKDLGQENVEARAAAVVAAEKSFAQSYPLPAEFRTLFVTRTKVSKAQLLERYPALGLKALLAKIPNQTLIRDLAPKNFAAVNEFLSKGDLQTSKDIYLIKASILDDAYPENFKKWFAFKHKYLGGPPERSDRQERCTKRVAGAFDKEADFVLLPRIFPSFPEAKFKAMAEQVRNSIIAGIEKATWLSPSARLEAQKKMRVARLQLIKPRNDKEWDFNPLATYSRTHQYANSRLLGQNLKRKDLTRMREKRDRNIWDMSPLTVNAYYSPPDNKFVMPIGILQYPFYDAKMPLASQFGAAGSVIGHELGHGIDDKGSLYDEKGRLHEWFSKDDMAEFKRRGEKLGQQFAAAGQNPELTMGENMGDLVGVSSSYRAMFGKGEHSLEEKREFFLGYGRVWCAVRGPGVKELRIKTDPHSLSENRVNQQIKQQPGFAEAFQCKEGDPMALKPSERVVIW